MESIIESILSFLQFDLAGLLDFSDKCCVYLCQRKKCAQLLAEVKEPLELCAYGEEKANAAKGSDEEPSEEDESEDDDDDDDDDDEEDCCMCCARNATPREDGDCDKATEVASLETDSTSCQTVGEQQSKDRCEAACQKILDELDRKCSSATLMELRSMEERAMKIWIALNAHVRSSCPNYPNWNDLETWQKLPFYWAALSNEILCEDPFENFKRFYTNHIRTKKRSQKLINERALIIWHNMSTKQRLPFVMEAFIGKVGAGKVNIKDEQEIHHVIKRLQRS